MPFTEFYCDASTGTNLNGGSDAGSASYTSVNGDWNNTTSVYTPTDGSTPASSVTVGQFASVYVDGAATSVYVARVTAVAAGVNGTITLSGTAKSGTSPTTSTTARSINVGGVWKGPTGTDGWPLNTLDLNATNAAGNLPRCNLKNTATYSITAAVTIGATGDRVRFEGYTTSVGDLGRFTLDGGTAGASYILLTISQVRCALFSFILQNNGATGSASGLKFTGTYRATHIYNGVVNSVRGWGIESSASTAGMTVVACECYSCNQSDTAALAGMKLQPLDTAVNCVSHDNNRDGFQVDGALVSGQGKFIRCIADTNTGGGFVTLSGALGMLLVGCDAYNNTGSGANVTSNTGNYLTAVDCNFIVNGAYGINANTVAFAVTYKSGYGSGTQANVSGATNGTVYETSPVTYASGATPWIDPANGDFRLVLAAALNAGYGTFTQTAASYTGTVGYPDIGAAQHANPPGVMGAMMFSAA